MVDFADTIFLGVLVLNIGSTIAVVLLRSIDLPRSPGDKIFMSTETSCHFGHLLKVSKRSLWSQILYIYFFMILYMYIAPGKELITLWGWNVYVNRNIVSLRSFIASFNKISLKSYIAPGQGQTAPWGQSFNVNRNALSLRSFVASIKQCLWSLTLYIFFYDLIQVYSPGQGQTAPREQNFDVNRKALSFFPFVSCFKEITLKYNFFFFFFLI